MEEDAFDAVEMLDLEIAKRFDAIYVREPKTAEDRLALLNFLVDQPSKFDAESELLSKTKARILETAMRPFESDASG